MEIVDKFLAVRKIGGSYPTGLLVGSFISALSYEVAERAPTETPVDFGVQYCCHLVFRLALNLDGRRRRIRTSWNCRRVMRFDLRDGEDWMDPAKVVGKAELDGVRVRSPQNLKGPEVDLRELAGRARGGYVLGEDIRLGSYRNVGCFLKSAVSGFPLVFAGFCKLRAKELVERIQVHREVECTSVGDVTLGVDGEARLIALVGEEGRDTSSTVGSGVVGEFRER